MKIARAAFVPILFAAALLLAGGGALAHESYMDCFDNGNETVTCVAGYEDGSPPTDRDVLLLKDADGKTLLKGNFDAEGAFSFERPAGDFMVIFMGAEIGHTLRINATDLIRR